MEQVLTHFYMYSHIYSFTYSLSVPLTNPNYDVNDYQLKAKTNIDAKSLKLDDVGYEYQKVTHSLTYLLTYLLTHLFAHSLIRYLCCHLVSPQYVG